MPLHVRFVILGKTARQNSNRADRAAHTCKLAASIGSLTCAFVLGRGRRNDLWAGNAGKSIGDRGAQVAIMGRWRLSKKWLEVFLVG